MFSDLKNNFLYNAGSELNEKTKNYEMFYRDYDAALGRMTAIDPMAIKYSSLTPYNYSFNDPIAFNDPLGDDPYTGLYGSRSATPRDGGVSDFVWDASEQYGFYKYYGQYSSGRDLSRVTGRYQGMGSGDHWSDQFSSSWTPSLGSIVTRLTTRKGHGGAWSSGGGYSFFQSEIAAMAVAYEHHSQFGTTSVFAHSGVSSSGRSLEQYKVDGQYIQRGADGHMYVPYTDVPISAAELANGAFTSSMVSLRLTLSGDAGYYPETGEGYVTYAGDGTAASLSLASIALFSHSAYENTRAVSLAKNNLNYIRELQKIRKFNSGYKVARQATLVNNIVNNNMMMSSIKLGARRMAGIGLIVGAADAMNQGNTAEAWGWVAADAIMTGVAMTGWGTIPAGLYFGGRFVYGLYDLATSD